MDEGLILVRTWVLVVRITHTGAMQSSTGLRPRCQHALEVKYQLVPKWGRLLAELLAVVPGIFLLLQHLLLLDFATRRCQGRHLSGRSALSTVEVALGS